VESLERIGRHALVAFHEEHFRPAALCVVIVGDVDPGEATDLAARELGGWSGAPSRCVVVPPPPSPAQRTRRVIVTPGKVQADIAYGFTTISRLDPRYYAYWMMNNILGQFGLGGRLADNIRERQGMAYYAFSMFDPNVGEGPLIVRAGVDPANVERALAAIDFEVGKFKAEGPTVAEMHETRDYLVGSIPRMLETNEAIAGFLQNAEQFGLGLHFDRQLPALLEGVTIEEVRQAAADVLDPDRAAVAVAGPSDSEGFR
jgi:zinc protease